MKINFSDEHKTGIEILDHEHQVLISTLVATSYSLLVDNLDVSKMKPHINLFSRMAKTHFRNEEEILEITDHPDKERHQQEHQKLEKELDEILLNSAHEDLVDKLGKWLIPHILEWDTKIKIANQVYPTHGQL